MKFRVRVPLGMCNFLNFFTDFYTTVKIFDLQSLGSSVQRIHSILLIFGVVVVLDTVYNISKGQSPTLSSFGARGF